MGLLSPDAVAFLHQPNSTLVASRSAALVPHSARAVAVRVADDRTHVRVWLPVASSQAVIADLRDSGRMSLTSSEPMQHRSLQLKGLAVEVEPAPEADREEVERAAEAFLEVLDRGGHPRRITGRMSRWPAWRVVLRVSEVFDQSPGPGAGARVHTAGER